MKKKKRLLIKYFIHLILLLIIANYSFIFGMKYLINKKAYSLQDILGKKNIIVNFSKPIIIGNLFWDVEVYIPHIRTSIAVMDKRFSLGIESINFPLRIFSDALVFNNLPQIAISYATEGDLAGSVNRVKFEHVEKAATGYLEAVDNSKGNHLDYNQAKERSGDKKEKSRIKLLFSHPLYQVVNKFLFSRFFSYNQEFQLKEADIFFEKISDQEKNIDISGFKIKISDFIIKDYTKENRMHKDKMISLHDDYAFIGEFLSSCEKINVGYSQNDDENLKKIKNLIKNLSLYSFSKNRIIKAEGKELLEKKISNTYIKTECCKIYIKEYDSLYELRKGPGPFNLDKMVDKAQGEFLIKNYPDLFSAFAYLQSYFASSSHTIAKPNLDNLAGFSDSVKKVLAKGDEKDLTLKIDQQSIDKIFINGLTIQELDEKMDFRLIKNAMIMR